LAQIVAVDIGGTHARFALAEIDAGRVVSLEEAVTLKTAHHASLQTAWEAFANSVGQALPRAAAIAIACPIQGETLKLTNNPWTIRPAALGDTLGADQLVLVNDFEAVGHAVAQAEPAHLLHLCGPDQALPGRGVITVVGPGTGLGVAQVVREEAYYHVQPTEGGHIDFAPTDAIEDVLLARLRQRHGRVSAERIVSGPGIVDIYQALAAIEGSAVPEADDLTLWTEGLAGEDSLASAAVDRFCATLGGVAGDITLAQGGSSVVIAGGLGYRLRDRLVTSGFSDRFCAKGRFAGLMASIPVKLIVHPQPGLLGAAAAFARAGQG
jgi:glucokinase